MFTLAQMEAQMEAQLEADKLAAGGADPEVLGNGAEGEKEVAI